ncbi:Microtubule-associated protein futsch [Toxocara canis]|uniref:Microtubule-associated protein futsch n=1 Tax=Toxocara canis TaxID=6265 RepID=A0A0B2VQP3_TOXCA|nr:Microtubule-associated protein futsch [Toxocara canis]
MAGETDLVLMLPEGHSVGSIRSRRPVVYIFTGGNEDAALFTVNGFSFLLDGGDQRQIPYWNLIRNYDKVSAVVATRVSPQCLTGISTIFARKLQRECHPTIGAFIGNLPPRSVLAGDSEVAHMVKTIYDGLHEEGIKPNEALASLKMEPITLYEVIGEGALRMIVLNPERGSKELSALANAIKTGENVEKHAVATSVAALFVWHPADANKPTIRILYPGACPLEKLYAALEKLKGEEYLRHVEYALADRDKHSPTISVNNRSVHAPLAASKPASHKPLATLRPSAPTTTATTVSTAAKKPTKPPSAAPSSRPSARTPPAAHTTTAAKTRATKTAVETTVKKVTKQPLTGAALSRMGGETAAKKPSPTKPTASASAKPAGGDAKPTPIRKPGAKPKEEAKKEKPAAPEPTPTPDAAAEPPKSEEHDLSPQHDNVPEPHPEPLTGAALSRMGGGTAAKKPSPTKPTASASAKPAGGDAKPTPIRKPGAKPKEEAKKEKPAAPEPTPTPDAAAEPPKSEEHDLSPQHDNVPEPHPEPLTGAALSRMGGGTAAKKPSPTKPTASASAKPAGGDAKPTPIRKPGAKPKEEAKKEKPAAPEPTPTPDAAAEPPKSEEHDLSPQHDNVPEPHPEPLTGAALSRMGGGTAAKKPSPTKPTASASAKPAGGDAKPTPIRKPGAKPKEEAKKEKPAAPEPTPTPDAAAEPPKSEEHDLSPQHDNVPEPHPEPLTGAALSRMGGGTAAKKPSPTKPTASASAKPAGGDAKPTPIRKPGAKPKEEAKKEKPAAPEPTPTPDAAAEPPKSEEHDLSPQHDNVPEPHPEPLTGAALSRMGGGTAAKKPSPTKPTASASAKPAGGDAKPTPIRKPGAKPKEEAKKEKPAAPEPTPTPDAAAEPPKSEEHDLSPQHDNVPEPHPEPLTGAALSRMGGGTAAKKPSPTKPTASASAKPAGGDAKPTPIRKPGAKPKEEAKKEKPAAPEPTPTPDAAAEPPKSEEHDLSPQHDNVPEPHPEPLTGAALAQTRIFPYCVLATVIGEGALRMIVLNPERGSKELSALANAIKTGENVEKHAVATSVAALFVWHPADANKPTIRILYPGACPLEKLYAALEKLKGEEYLRHVEYALADRDKHSPTISVNNRSVHAPLAASKPASHKPLATLRPSAPTTTATTVSTAAKKPTKPPSAAPSSRPSARTPPAAHTTTAAKTRATKTAVETTVKKVTKQPLTGAALSRMGGETAAKKPSPTKPTASASAKPAGGDAKPTPIRKPGAKPKEEAKKEKPAAPEPTPTPDAAAEPPKSEEHDLSPQHDNVPEPHPEHESKSKEQPESEPEPKPKEQPAPQPEPEEQPKPGPEHESPSAPPPVERQHTPPPPQNLDVNGLLDGIEEPMKLRKISMDTGKGLDAEDAAKLFAADEIPNAMSLDSTQTSLESPQKSSPGGADLLDMSKHGDDEVYHHISGAVAHTEQDVPLLDSTPDMPVAPHIQEQHSSMLPQMDATGDHLTAPNVTEQHSHIEELLGTGACPFTAGLVSSIVDDATAESALRKMSAPPAMALVKGDYTDAVKPADIGIKMVNGSATKASPQLTQRSVPGSSLPDSLTSPASHDSVNAQPDAALDDVIESLAGESEREDNPKGVLSPTEEHVDGKQNGGPDHMAAQNAMEDADAQELYMPPITDGPRMRAGAASSRPSFGGAVAKPKISQPLYFDVVFVPHHGAHPALVDEAAAKAFAISVRSKRYVLSGKDSIKPYILDGFVAAKTVWNKPELEIDVVPTYDSDDLRAYNQLKAGEMSEAGVNLRCSVERCTLRLSSGDSDDVCAAFKFEM